MASDSPTDRELLELILWRLVRIEKRLGIPEWRIGDGDPPPGPREQGPVVGVEGMKSKPIGGTEPPLLPEQGRPSRGKT
jgi:hypothetical protein